VYVKDTLLYFLQKKFKRNLSVVGVRAADFAAEHSPTPIKSSIPGLHSFRFVGEAAPLIPRSTSTKE
jgi:hypothetical protein